MIQRETMLHPTVLLPMDVLIIITFMVKGIWLLWWIVIITFIVDKYNMHTGSVTTFMAMVAITFMVIIYYFYGGYYIYVNYDINGLCNPT